jgi:hypothetical protein
MWLNPTEDGIPEVVADQIPSPSRYCAVAVTATPIIPEKIEFCCVSMKLEMEAFAPAVVVRDTNPSQY